MLKYAKLINEQTQACDVGVGTNTDFYKSIGMVEMDVEQAWDGTWYIKGYAPKKPAPTKEEIAKSRELRYIAEVDTLTAQIQRLRDKEPSDEIMAEIAALVAKRDANVEQIRADLPYPEGVEDV